MRTRSYLQRYTNNIVLKWNVLQCIFLKSHADIEDAVQNAFMQMIRHFEKIYEIPCEELSFWIISIVKNEALMIIRKSQKTVPLEDWDGLVRESENTSDYTELVDLFTKLPSSYRSVLEMKSFTDFLTKRLRLIWDLGNSSQFAGIPRAQPAS